MSDCTCSVCSKLFVDPRILPCLHTFCRACLETSAPLPAAGQGVRCPQCRKAFPVAAKDLHQNVHVGLEVKVAQVVTRMAKAGDTTCEGCCDPANGSTKAFCAECDEMICERCWDHHKRHLSLKRHKIVPCGAETDEALRWLLRATEYCCPNPGHEGEEWCVYCETCGSLVCQKCLDQDHREHRCVPLDVAFKAQREETNALLGRARGTMADLALAVENRDAAAEEIESSRRDAAHAIVAAFEELERCLRERKKALLANLERIAVPSATAVSIQKKELDKMYKEFSEYYEATSRILQTHTDAELVALKGLPRKQLQEACESAPLSLVPYTTAALSLDTSGLAGSVFGLGAVEECSPAHSTWTPCAHCTPLADTQYQVRVEVRSPSGERLTSSNGLTLRGELVSTSQGKPVAAGEVERHRDGTYTITFIPHTFGPHLLHVTIGEQHAANSPSHLYINRNYAAADMAVLQRYAIRAPNFIAVRENGDLYVTSDLVHVLDQAGNERFTIGAVGSGEGQFSSPQGIAIYGDVMYVADKFNHRIQKVTLGGQVLKTFGQGQSAGVCVDHGGRIVAANGQNAVLIFNQAGNLVQSISGAVTGGNAGFHCPHGVAVDPEGNIHVTARKSSAVKVFSDEGTYIRMYGNLIEPTGIAIDRGGYCLVCEMYTSHVTVFDPQGKQVTKIQTRLLKQLGITLDNNGRVYVSSYDDNMIVKL